MNNFVDINFVSDNRSIICLFPNQQQGLTRQCSVNITYGENCEFFLAPYSTSGPSNSLPSPSIEFLSTVSEYCFTVVASSGNKSVIVEGNLNLITSTIGETKSVLGRVRNNIHEVLPHVVHELRH